ncbi:MAG: ABC transporter substrate-binding protein [Burkholderiales bacterium]|nr:ABC transporter substrate-binding protein [Burkholderiales bacterium]
MTRKLLGLLLALASSTVWAEVVVGVSVSATGPGASLGVHVAKAIALLPKSIGGETVRYVVLDDTSDPTVGAKNVRRFAVEDKVDAIIGSSTVPVALAQGAVANEARIPFIALCPIPIDAARQTYLFAVPQPIPLMVSALVEHMQANKVKTVGYIGFSDSWGDANYNSLKGGGAAAGLEVTTNERYTRADTAVTGQMLKVLASNPDAIFVGASGTPADLPQIAAVERGYRKQIYHTHGVVNPDFIRVGGKSAEGVIAATGPVVVAEQLAANDPLKATGLQFLKEYESAYGAGSRNAFAAYAWDAGVIVQAALPVALKATKPGTPAFRDALRDAIEAGKDVKGTHAVYNMSPTDHYGVDKRARVLVKVDNGEWKLVR